MQGITKSGYEYNIDERAFQDWRFVAALADCQKNRNNPLLSLAGVQELTRLAFGKDFENYINYIASKNDGFCPTEIVMLDINEIFKNANAKN